MSVNTFYGISAKRPLWLFEAYFDHRGKRIQNPFPAKGVGVRVPPEVPNKEPYERSKGRSEDFLLAKPTLRKLMLA